MARMPRLGVANWPQLVVQRVHEGQTLVRDDTDAALLLSTLRDAAREAGVAIHAYAVADDHLHLLATPGTIDGLSTMMQSLGRRYVAAFNRRHGRQGGLWSGRYRSTVIEPARYLLDGMAFIELHALRAGSVQQAVDDRWSSAGHHLGLRADPLIQDHPLFWALGNTPFEREAAWQRRLDQGLSAMAVNRLADATHKGWALGGDDFLQQLQAAAGRRVQPKPRGRPRRIAAPEGVEAQAK
ncbi:MAG: transposase [Burkholderiales bacterium]|nr:transposase [Burkholderiales bacterium]